MKQASLSELVDTRGERAALGGLAGAVGAPLIAKLFKDEMTLQDYLTYGLLGGGLGFGGTALTEEAMDQISKARAAFEKAPHGDPAKFKQEVEERIKNHTKSAFIYRPSEEQQLLGKLSPTEYNSKNFYQIGNMLAGGIPGGLIGALIGSSFERPRLGLSIGGILGATAGGLIPEMMAKPENAKKIKSITPEELALADKAQELKDIRHEKGKWLGLGAGLGAGALAIGAGYSPIALAAAIPTTALGMLIADSTSPDNFDKLIIKNPKYKSLIKKLNNGKPID